MIVTDARTIWVAGVARAAAAGALVLLLGCAALAQSEPPLQLGVAPAGDSPAQTAPAPTAPAPTPLAPPAPGEAPAERSNPSGLLGAIGRFFDDSMDNMASGWNSARDAVGDLGGQATEAAKGAADAARDAAATVARLPGTSFVSGRQLCVRTGNGGPDCDAATEALCRSKGFTTGTSMHIQSEQKCPVWGWINGKQPIGRCGTATYVTSAMCR